jgi:hypothetical protein
MANVGAIRSVGQSLARYLQNAYTGAAFPPNITKPPCTFAVVSGNQFGENFDADAFTAHLLIFLYRVNINSHLRTSGRLQNPDARPNPLSVDINMLFSAWMASAEDEHLVLAWLMRELHLNPVLDASTLTQEAGWDASDAVQIIPSELSTEDLMRIWDAIVPSYRLSVSYIARVIRLDPDPADVHEFPAVVATRTEYAMPRVTEVQP